jgi:hypothetical protein
MDSGQDEGSLWGASSSPAPKSPDWRLRFPLVYGNGIEGMHGPVMKPFGAWKNPFWPESARDPDAVLQWLDFYTQGEPNPIGLASHLHSMRRDRPKSYSSDLMHDAFLAVNELAFRRRWSDPPQHPRDERSLDETRHELLRLFTWVNARHQQQERSIEEIQRLRQDARASREQLLARAFRIGILVDSRREEFAAAVVREIWDRAGKYVLPLIPIPPVPSRDEKLLTLALIHRYAPGDVAPIDPWQPNGAKSIAESLDSPACRETLCEVAFDVCAASVEELPEQQLAIIDKWIEEFLTSESLGPLSAHSPAREARAAFLGGEALANALNVHPSRQGAFLRQLGRIRSSLGDDYWIEVSDRRPNSPQFLYRSDSTQLRALAAEYQLPKSA